MSILATVVVLTAAARATVPGENGRIAFRRLFTERGNWGAIFTVKPDGSDPRQITHPRRRLSDVSPDWSPDGRWIVFQRIREERNAMHPDWILRVRPNGRELQNLSRTWCHGPIDPPEPGKCIGVSLPNWSPHGHWIAFSRLAWTGEGKNQALDLFRVRPDGTDVRRITGRGPTRPGGGDGALDYGPVWSPGGQRLVFERYVATQRRSSVFTIRPDGHGLRRLTPWAMDAGEPTDWSPDGRWILFLNHSEGDVPSTLWLMHPNGTARHRITATGGGAFTWGSGSFSPDGTQATVWRRAWPDGSADVFVIDLDGTIIRNLTASAEHDSFPDWGPVRR
jgi:Tol biopolymer transport system component